MAHKEADNTNNENTNLNEVRVCNHWAALLSEDWRTKKLPSIKRADRCCPATPRPEYHIIGQGARARIAQAGSWAAPGRADRRGGDCVPPAPGGQRGGTGGPRLALASVLPWWSGPKISRPRPAGQDVSPAAPGRPGGAHRRAGGRIRPAPGGRHGGKCWLCRDEVSVGGSC